MSNDFEKVVNEPVSDECCGGPATTNVDACCVADEEAKSAGKDGCGC
ncbi:hypothetical protein [Chengkuizengella sediminis]|nr:hypothetical protein [Chengkuizengella sediminis]NDI34181.1 hypothetical protein [Chengkuizengella sediminis]